MQSGYRAPAEQFSHCQRTHSDKRNRYCPEMFFLINKTRQRVYLLHLYNHQIFQVLPSSKSDNLSSIRTSSELHGIQCYKDCCLFGENCILTVKACDKGSGIILMDNSDFVKSYNEHLNSSLKLAQQPNSS